MLAELQKDGRLSVTELADRVGLSLSPCHRRLKALEDAAGMALWLDTDMDTASANVILAAGQGLLSGDETPEAVMEKVRAAAKETLAQR